MIKVKDKDRIKNKVSNKKKNSIKSNLVLVIVSILMFSIGIFIFFYPTISNYIANKEFQSVIKTYDEDMKNIDKEDLSLEYDKALEYNRALNGVEIHDPFELGTGYVIPDNYNEVLNIFGNGVMGYIEISKISLKLPIYHSSDDKILEKGVGHLESTALPIGGEGNNPILTGHRGLPQAELFTRLDELKNGDIISIYILNDILSYEVFDIKVIKPDDVKSLKPLKDMDMITLITCTPYGINTHRLIIQGKRVPYVAVSKKSEASTSTLKLTESVKSRIYGIIVGIIILIVFLFIMRKKKNEKKS